MSIKRKIPKESEPFLNGAKKKFGFVPNLLTVLARSPKSLEAYLSVSELFGKSGLNPVEQQLVLITASISNDCEYCVAAHSTIALMQKMPEEVLVALRDGQEIPDKKLEALRQFTIHIVEKRGFVSQDDRTAFLSVGYLESNIHDVILGVTQKTLSNYTNHIFQTEVDEVFSKFAWKKSRAA